MSDEGGGAVTRETVSALIVERLHELYAHVADGLADELEDEALLAELSAPPVAFHKGACGRAMQGTRPHRRPRTGTVGSALEMVVSDRAYMARRSQAYVPLMRRAPVSPVPHRWRVHLALLHFRGRTQHRQRHVRAAAVAQLGLLLPVFRPALVHPGVLRGAGRAVLVPAAAV
jgi:hypothetical protein